MATPLTKIINHKKLCSNADIEALSNYISRDEIGNHSMENEFVDISYGLTCHNLSYTKHKVVGICKDVVPHMGMHYGVVFTNESGERKWVHICDSILNSWVDEIEEE